MVISGITVGFVVLIYSLIAMAGTAVAECVKKMYIAIKKYNTGTLKKIRINPIILYCVVAVITIPSVVVFTLFYLTVLWPLIFVIPLVFCLSIIAYDLFLQVIMEIPELIKGVLRNLFNNFSGNSNKDNNNKDN